MSMSQEMAANQHTSSGHLYDFFEVEVSTYAGDDIHRCCPETLVVVTDVPHACMKQDRVDICLEGDTIYVVSAHQAEST
jgi:hypothetical protein